MSDKKSKTRERILDAACSALIQHGPAEPSVSQVMSAAGLTVGGFYAHFDSKDELMLEHFASCWASDVHCSPKWTPASMPKSGGPW